MRMITFVLLTITMALGACDLPDIDDVATAAGEECQRIFDEERPKIVADIRAECEELMDKALATCEEQCNTLLSDAIDELLEWFDKRIDSAEEEIMTRAGCTPDESDFGWDCEASPVCEWVVC